MNFPTRAPGARPDERPRADFVFALLFCILPAFAILPLLTACAADAGAAPDSANPPAVPRGKTAAPAAAVTRPAARTTPPPAAPVPARPLPPVDLNATFARWKLAPIAQKNGSDTAIWANAASGVKIELRRNKAYAIINGTRVWLGKPVAETNRRWRMERADFDNALLPVLAPVATILGSGIAPRRPVHVFLDPGHGGDDTGCQNAALRLQEKALTLDVANRVRHILERQGFRVTLSRTRDIALKLDDRPAAAARAKADLFVSIHFNSNGSDSTVTGIETYTLPPRGQSATNSPAAAAALATARAADPGQAWTAWNTILAYKIQSRLAPAAGATGAAERGVRRARFAVLRQATMPAVLVECGFLPSAVEGAKIRQPAHREKLAQAIANGILSYRDTVAAAAAKKPPAPKPPAKR